MCPRNDAVAAGPREPASLAPEDRVHLERAVALGRRGWGRVHPNPMVGCVLVRDGRVVGEGWHRAFGAPHAEAEALARAGAAAGGGVAYVSLEPCRHQGKTPPCTRALLEAGIARLVYGATDPGRESGGGARELEAAGVEVLGPALAPAEARRENPAFFHRDPTRPWTTLKLATSLDGRIAAAPDRRTPVSGPESVREVHRLRAGFDAILVGTRTALVDDPLLTVRGPVAPRVPPRRVFLDARGRLDPEARALREGEGDVWLVTTPDSPGAWRRRMENAGARVLEAPARAGGRIALEPALALLRREGVGALLCEGGGILASGLLEEGLVDRIHLILAPRFLGAGGVEAFPAVQGEGDGGDAAAGAAAWVPAGDPVAVGEDVWITLDREDP